MEPDDRTAFLSAACGGDAELRAEVQALLGHDEQPQALFKTPAIKAGLQFSGVDGANAIPNGESTPLPESVGGYRIEQVIGEGGFGVVYLAIQENPKRTVALKVIRPGLATPQMLRRFEYEAQVLGLLTHPGIAQIYEAGTEDTGHGVRAFFAMEYIRGQRLDHYAKSKALTAESRLDLIARVCDAVQYAHQKGVVHRDLKPQNILVDDSGNPKILDFGVSRATDTDIYTTTLQTTAGQLIGTLPYMSPEQVSGDPREVDTRSDVYAVGVILYQLLTGKLPHDLASRSIPEAAQVIRDEQPSRLSSYSKAFRGDVDTIVLKSMEKDKSLRYQSAADLAADIRRHLRGEPIEAKRSSGWYVLQKKLRRYKVAATISFVGVFLLLLASIGLFVLYDRSVEQAEIARKERDSATQAREEAERETRRARAEEQRANSVRNFILRTLQSADPRSSRGADRTVREVLDAVSEWLDESFRDDPRIEATLRETVGQTYLGLGLIDKAELHIMKALALRENMTDGPAVEYADALQVYGTIRSKQGHHAECLKALNEALAIYEENLPADGPKIGSVLMNIGSTRIELNELDGVEELMTRAVEIARHAPPIDGPQEHEDSDLAAALSALGKMKYAKRDMTAAESYFREAIDLVEQKLGADHPMLAPLYNNVAGMLDMQNRTDEGLEFSKKSLELARRTLGPKHVDVSHPLCSVGQSLVRLDRHAEAEPCFREALDIRRAGLEPGHPLFGQVLSGLGRSLVGQQKAAEAEPILREALAIRMNTSPPGDYGIGYTGGILGECLLQLKKLDEAERTLQSAYQTVEKARGPGCTSALASARNLFMLYEQRGDTGKSTEWKVKSEISETP